MRHSFYQSEKLASPSWIENGAGLAVAAVRQWVAQLADFGIPD
jgi:hypothetical protein